MPTTLPESDDDVPTGIHERPTWPEDVRPTIVDPSCAPQSGWVSRLRDLLDRIRARFRRTPAPPPLPPARERMSSSPTLVSSGVFVFEEILSGLWRLPPEQLDAVVRLAEHVREARDAGAEAAVDARILYVLARLMPAPGGVVSLALLRDKLLGLPRSSVDQGLLRLEASGRIVLFSAPMGAGLAGTGGSPGAGIEHPTRGILERCALVPERHQGRGVRRAA
ncbi:hypothetical protein [Polyangium sp. y55x31]|uniref:hypothetical protein n=1 Tax=Polyangium sp. y55x31 TaxID=3042688 RepID=UPI0024821E31|nr:hypothetical protein [Polyangium sp. y55x31]MDI1479527.1 hypothetical protein [Polyangium sp. y55x31]